MVINTDGSRPAAPAAKYTKGQTATQHKPKGEDNTTATASAGDREGASEGVATHEYLQGERQANKR